MKLEAKRRAIKLRQKGYSLGEIRAELGVAKSSASLWVRDVKLSKKAQEIILSKLTKGQEMSIIAHHKITKEKRAVANEFAKKAICGIKVDKKMAQLLSSLLYACEGAKTDKDLVGFTNSDPDMISVFLSMLRRGFDLDEKKFRPVIHLHDYHNGTKQLNFWSKTARIPKDQFIKPYNKPHTGLHKKEGYEGCVSIRYHSVDLGRKLLAIASEFIRKHR